MNTVGRRGLFNRIASFNVDDVPPEIVARARQIVKQTSEEEVKETASGLVTFYAWVSLGFKMLAIYGNKF